LEFLGSVRGQVGIPPLLPPAMSLSEWTWRMVHRQDGEDVAASNGVIGFFRTVKRT
jgi:hypothetical protein